MRTPEYENLGKRHEAKPELINMAVNLGMMTGCGACGDVTDQVKCAFCAICPRTKKCKSLKFDEYCENLNAQKLVRELLPELKDESTEKEHRPIPKSIVTTSEVTEEVNCSILDEIKSDLINKAVHLGMMTGCNACSDASDQEKCAFCEINPNTRKCSSLRFDEYCDHLEAQRLARVN